MSKVLKFGGTSVGSAENMRKVASIIVDEGSYITVLSAMSETTNGLVKICDAASRSLFDVESFEYLHKKYRTCVDELLGSKEEAYLKIEEIFALIKGEATQFSAVSESIILAQGELLTTFIFTLYLRELGLKAELIDITECMQTDCEDQADTHKLERTLREIITQNDADTIYVTQGFICRNHQGNLSNLGRGGSDYSAALIGAAVGSSEVQIWTDIDGMHNNDPRYVEGTFPIRKMSFVQAAELAYFGAKILHPSTILPCQKRSVPVRLKNTLDAKAEGTLITKSDDVACQDFTAIAAKDGITSIRICSARMLMAYGFLRRVFEVFEKYKTPIDMITTSEVAVSLTIDKDCYLSEIIEDLEPFGKVTVERDNSIICVVGNIDPHRAGMVSKALDGITNIPVKMISYGASNSSVAILIDSKDKIKALKQLNNQLF